MLNYIKNKLIVMSAQQATAVRSVWFILCMLFSVTCSAYVLGVLFFGRGEATSLQLWLVTGSFLSIAYLWMETDLWIEVNCIKSKVSGK